jgi:hypothetical protein
MGSRAGKMRRKRKGNLVELPLLIALVGLSVGMFIGAHAVLRNADYGLLAIPIALLGVVGFWVAWIAVCYIVKTAIKLVRPSSEVDTAIVFIYATILAMLPLSLLGIGILIWYLIVRPLVWVFT